MAIDESWNPPVILTDWWAINKTMQEAKKLGVMIVEARGLHDPRPNGPCRMIEITVTPKEGYGQPFMWRFVHISGESIPTATELHLMDYNCVCTWGWRTGMDVGRYTADFAHQDSHKAIKNSRSYEFPAVL